MHLTVELEYFADFLRSVATRDVRTHFHASIQVKEELVVAKDRGLLEDDGRFESLLFEDSAVWMV